VNIEPVYIFISLVCFLCSAVFFISSILIKFFPNVVQASEDDPRNREWKFFYTFIGSILLLATGTAFLYTKIINPTAPAIGFFISTLFLIGTSEIRKQNRSNNDQGEVK